ncbi:MAG: superoxide dismutase, Cu-Zn family [Thermomicrobiales bacterium]|nr:superoxide dismutase, Cu-Zn family [Thermomicrobiales bacterium]
MKSKLLVPTIAALGAIVLGLGGVSQTIAQEGTPAATPIVGASQVAVVIQDVDGNDVGNATFTEGGDGVVTVEVEVQGLPAGEHGIHVHETGVCDPSGDQPFSSAGGHYNPAGTTHGGPPAAADHDMAAASGSPEAGTGHAGDLGNISVGDDGTGTLTIQTDRFTLSIGPTTLQDADGSALVIHANADDLMTDPSGNSGGRIACGVIFPPAEGTPVASHTS